MSYNLIAVSNHGEMIGGGEHSFFELISKLPPEWKPMVILPCRGELANRFESNRAATGILFLPPIRPCYIHLIIKCIFQLIKLSIKFQSCLIYANGSRAAFFSGIAGIVVKKPVIWHCRIADSDPFLDPLLIRLADKIISNSRATAARFPKTIQKKVVVVHNGIDLKYITYGQNKALFSEENNWKNILVVARISRFKRHDTIISAFEKIAEKFAKVRLIIVGGQDCNEPEWWDEMQCRTAASIFSERICWVGPVNDVRPFYLAASMMVLASENESFGRVIVEAMANGVPVIATESGGIPEILNNGIEGILFDVGRADQLAEAMELMLSQPELASVFGAAGRMRAREFSIQKHVDEMSRIFHETSEGFSR